MIKIITKNEFESKINDFDIISGVYDFINDRDCVCREFDDVLGTKNNKVRIYNK